MEANNSLASQSRDHPHGWGIGWWDETTPNLERSVGAAFAEERFSQVAAGVRARSAVAHIRLASVGNVNTLNTHPFTWGPWLFAHNGTIPRFAAIREEFERWIAPAFRPLVVGETDSIRCFALFLSRLGRLTDPACHAPIEAVAQALAETSTIAKAIADAPGEEPTATTFLVGDGSQMVACRSERSLFLSARGSEASLEDLQISSEDLRDQRQWKEVPQGGIVGVDADFRLRRFHISDWALPTIDAA